MVKLQYMENMERKKHILLRSVMEGLFEMEDYLSDKEVVRVLEEVLTVVKKSEEKKLSLKSKQIIPSQAVYEQETAFGETELFQSQNEQEVYLETTLLETSMRLPFLIRQSTKEKILINRDIFKLGKERSYVDYYIDNDAVSRSHADIIRQKNHFFVIDHNSLNHTFLEGKQIPAKQYVKLESGQRIVLANEEFIFCYEAI